MTGGGGCCDPRTERPQCVGPTAAGRCACHSRSPRGREHPARQQPLPTAALCPQWKRPWVQRGGLAGAGGGRHHGPVRSGTRVRDSSSRGPGVPTATAPRHRAAGSARLSRHGSLSPAASAQLPGCHNSGKQAFPWHETEGPLEKAEKVL